MTAVINSTVKVGQRVKVLHSNVDYNIGREGVVKEIHPHCGAIRVELDKAWMHDWVNPWDVEVIEDEVEWLEAGDCVRVERLVRRADALPQYGTLVEVQPTIQWGRVQFDNSRRSEWFPVSELYLEQKAANR